MMTLELFSGLDTHFWYKGRLDTFGRWPFKPEDGCCTPERMAAAGFYVPEGTEEPDAAECFICGKQLDGWEPNDDPWQEHEKHQKNCDFIKLNKQDEKQYTVDDLFQLMKVFYTNQATRKRDQVVKSIKMQSQSMTKKIPSIYKTVRNSRKGGN